MPPPSPPYRISITAIPVVLHTICRDCPPMSSLLPLFVIPKNSHKHRLCCYRPMSLFQYLSQYLSLSCVLHRCLSLCYCVYAVSPPPPFISFPNLYRFRRYLTRHLLFHRHCPPHLLYRHFCPAFTVSCLLSPLPFIIYCHGIEPLLSPPPCDTSFNKILVNYKLLFLIFFLLFNLLVMHCSISYSIIFSLLFNLITLFLSSILATLS